MTLDIDIDHLRRWIGREESAEEVLTEAQVARFAATFDLDRAAAPGAEAPPLIHLCLCQPAAPTASLGPDGHPARGGFLPPVPLPRRMWAGGAFDFHAPLRVGEVVRRRSVIESVALKTGRSGVLCFVTLRHHITSGGRPALTERQDLVYRAAEGAGRPVAGAGTGSGGLTPAPEGASRRRVDTGAAFLFRYSALTFNGHRIHYDAPYARDEEGYPGLVVHGPLQATLLVQLAADLGGRTPARFAFRALSPVFGGGGLMLHADKDGPGLRLWTARPGGPVAMEATASW